MKDYNVLYTCLCILFFFQSGIAQDASIKLIWEEEEEVFFSGNLHRVTSEFTTSADQRVKLIIKPEPPLKLLSPSSYKIDSKKEEINSSSIKIYLPQTAESDKDSLSCEFIIQSLTDQTILGKKKLCLEIKERIVIRMEPQRDQIPIKATDSLALVPIRVKNMGKRKYMVRVALKDKPPGLKILESEKEFMLRPKVDTLINFKIRPDKNWQKVNSAYLKYVLTLIKTEEKIADCKVTAFPMGHVKKYYSPSFMINQTHEFGLGIQHRGANQNVIDFSSKGKSPVFKGLLNYELQSFYYSSTKDMQLSRAFLNYYANQRSLTIGHVNYSSEATLSGRGITYEVEKDSQYMYLGFINGSYKLFAPTLASNSFTGNSFVGSFRKIVPGFGLIESNGIIRFRSPANTGLFWVNNTINKKRNYLNIRLGFSGKSDKSQIANNSILAGLLLSADYEKEANTWTFQSSNIASTPGYAGNNPGVLSSYNKFVFLGWDHMNIKGSARIQKATGFKKPYEQIEIRKSNIIKYQLQFETKQTGFWRLIVTPYQTFNRKNLIDRTRPEDFYVSKSSRIKMVLSRRKGSLAISCNSDVGYFEFGKYESTQKQFLSYQLGLKLSTKNLGFNTGYSQGSRQLSNAITYEQSGLSNSDFYVNSRWGKWFFKRKNKVTFSAQLSYNNIRNLWTNSNALRIRSILPKGFTLDTEFVAFKSSDSNSLFWNLKLIKKIGSYRPPSGAKKLKLTLFEDANNSGLMEAPERTLPGIFVKVDDIPFVTSESGSIQYKSVPVNEYAVSIMDPSGELAGNQQTIAVERNTEINIPLYKTVQLNGIVKELKQRFKSSKFDILGIPVIAKNIQEEVVTTYTQPDGSFTFNLPENEYTIYIDASAFGKNFEFPDNYQKVTLTQDEPSEISLSVRVKSRKMTIQKF